jgi:hypothetical protein
MTRNDALCIAFVYHFADLAIGGQPQARRILDRFEDADWVHDAYTQLVEDLAAEILPDEWETRFDYWGGKCFSTSQRWSDPKSGTVMAGESHRYLACDSEAIIRKELSKALELEPA